MLFLGWGLGVGAAASLTLPSGIRYKSGQSMSKAVRIVTTCDLFDEYAEVLYEQGGLALTMRTVPRRFRRTCPRYSVTHIASGFAVRTGNNKREMKRLLLTLLPLTDWTGTARHLREIKGLEAAVHEAYRSVAARRRTQHDPRAIGLAGNGQGGADEQGARR